MAEKLSVLLSELSVKAKAMEDKFAAAESKSKEQLQQWESDVKTKAQANKIAFDRKINSLNAEAKSNWEKVKSNFESGVTKVKSDFMNASRKVKAANAEISAEWAEDNAEMSLYIALVALSDAEEAVIDAVKAREKAESY